MTALTLPTPYLLFLGDIKDPAYAKTAYGVKDWSPDLCVAELACGGSDLTVGLPAMSPEEARTAGARSVLIGVAPMGGTLADTWLPYLTAALEAGLDIVSGLHKPLADIPELKMAAERHGRQLIDIRKPPANLPIATGRKRSGKRLLTVGTDCALGKKYTALALTDAFRKSGMDATFRATGQTGILIAGEGIPIDSVVSDFIAGAAETLSPDAAETHWDVIEGQGSLYHPSYAGVSLGLLHGSQPDVFVLCHKAGRERILGLDTEYPIPDLKDAIDLHLVHARRVNSKARCAGISLNTAGYSPEDARAEIEEITTYTGLPCADPIRGGAPFDMLVQSCLS